MILSISRVLVIATIAQAFPQPQISGTQSTNGSNTSNRTYTIPASDPNPAARAEELARSRAGYLYGPSKIGNSSFFLTGSLGDERVNSDVGLFNRDAMQINATVRADATSALENLIAVS